MDAPNDVAVRSNTRHKMPPSMAFQKETPGHTNLSPPVPKIGAVDVVYAPDREAAQEDSQSVSDQYPHLFQDARIANIIDLLLLLRLDRQILSFPFQSILLSRLPEVRPQTRLHTVHAPEHNKHRQSRIDVLMKHWVL